MCVAFRVIKRNKINTDLIIAFKWDCFMQILGFHIQKHEAEL